MYIIRPKTAISALCSAPNCFFCDSYCTNGHGYHCAAHCGIMTLQRACSYEGAPFKQMSASVSRSTPITPACSHLPATKPVADTSSNTLFNARPEEVWLQTMTYGQYESFGEAAAVQEGVRGASVITNMYTELLVLTKHDLLQNISAAAKEHLEEIVKKRTPDQDLMRCRSCSSCLLMWPASIATPAVSPCQVNALSMCQGKGIVIASREYPEARVELMCMSVARTAKCDGHITVRLSPWYLVHKSATAEETAHFQSLHDRHEKIPKTTSQRHCRIMFMCCSTLCAGQLSRGCAGTNTSATWCRKFCGAATGKTG